MLPSEIGERFSIFTKVTWVEEGPEILQSPYGEWDSQDMLHSPDI